VRIVSAVNVSKDFCQSKDRPSLLGWVAAYVGILPKAKRFPVISKISFDIEQGTRLALLGRNGAGKTTLLKLIAGIFVPNSGKMVVNHNVSALFKLSTGVGLNLSVTENIFLLGLIFGAEEPVIQKLVGEILRFAELEEFGDWAVKDLSAGQAQRIAISVFLFTCAQFVVFDESFAYLDSAFARKCEGILDRMRMPTHTLILSSHDIDFLRRHCTHALWIDHGRLIEFGEFEKVSAAFETG